MKDQLMVLDALEKQFQQFQRNPRRLLWFIVAVYVSTYFSNALRFSAIVHLLPALATCWLLFWVYVQFLCRKADEMLQKERKKFHEYIQNYKIHCDNFELSLDEWESRDGAITVTVLASMRAGAAKELQNITGTLHFYREKGGRNIAIAHYNIVIRALKADLDEQIELPAACSNFAHWTSAAFEQEGGHEYRGGRIVDNTLTVILNAKMLGKSNFSRSMVVFRKAIYALFLRIRFHLSQHIFYSPSNESKYTAEQKSKLLTDTFHRLGWGILYLLLFTVSAVILFWVLRYDLRGIRACIDAWPREPLI